MDVAELWGRIIRLSIWDDGSAWLGVHRPGPRRSGGWAFSFKAYGCVARIEPASVVAMFEQTLAAPDEATHILDLWAAADLAREA